MKNLIQSKPIGTANCYAIRNVDAPKPLLKTNWQIRNNSTNIKAVLYPESQLHPRKGIKNVPENSAQKKNQAYKKQYLSSNTCYCKEKPIRPSLFNRPNKCLTLEEFEDKISEKNILNQLPKIKTSLHCFCKGVQASADHIDLSDQNTLKKLQDELDEVNPNLQITDQRVDYELYRNEEHSNYLKDIAAYGDDEIENEYETDINTIVGTIKTNPKQHSSKFIRDGLTDGGLQEFICSDSDTDLDDAPEQYHSRQSCRPSSTSKDAIYNNRSRKYMCSAPCFSGVPVSNGNTSRIVSRGSSSKTRNAEIRQTQSDAYTSSAPSMDTQDMRMFRDENYFETHDVEEHLKEDIPTHTCVHQFALDSRLLPQAVSIDRRGKSRCTICSKPMDDIHVSEKPLFSDKITREKIRKFSKCYELGLIPHDITIGSREKIELTVRKNDLIKFGKFIGSYKRPCPINSFALRQQKMLTYEWR